MENVIHRLTLDLTGADMMPRVEVQQDNARSIVICLTQGGRPYWIAEGVTAVFSGRKPDGNPLFNACTIEKNRVRYDFTPQTTNVAGIVECEILLYSGDERILASPRFELAIDELIHRDGDVPESAPEVSALTQMVAAGTAMIEDLREALAGLEGVEEILTQARAAMEDAEAAATHAADSEAAAKGHAKTAADAAGRAEDALAKMGEGSVDGDLKVNGLILETRQENDGETGVILTPEGTADKPVAHLYGVQGDEPVVVRGVAPAVLDEDVPNLGQVKEMVEESTGNGFGQNVDLTGYAKEAWVREGFQPKGNYLTTAPVESVNGKTGKVTLSASDVGARPNTWMPTAQEVGALPSTYTPPNQTAEQVGADPKGTAASAVSGHNTNATAHNDIRQELVAINARLTAFFDSDNQTLDELSEIVAYITSNKSLIDAITTSKVSVADIINNLTTNVANKPLSAAQGVAIKALIDNLSASLANYQPKGNYALASAVPTKVSQLANDKGYLTEHQDISGKADKFDPTVYGLPVLWLTGDTAPIAVSKDNKVTLNYAYGERSGSCTLKGQGATSYKTAQALVNAGKKGKFNYTIKFDTAFEAKEGWGAQQKYCLKANFIDTTHSRNICSCELWGMSVKARSVVPPEMANLPNGGAIDGFPVVIMLNGEFHGLYTWNIPKDGWMFGLVEDTAKTQAIVGADDHTAATQFKEASMSGFEVEFVSDEDNADWVQTSLTRMLAAVLNSNGSDLDTTVAQYLDWDSCIDHFIHTVVDKAMDCVDKNYLLVTFNGVKWYMSEYDRDSIHGLEWDASGTSRPVSDCSFIACAETVRVYELIKRFKTNALKARYKELRGNILSESRIMQKFENFAWAIPLPVMVEDVKLYPTIKGSGVNTIDQIGRFVRQRLVRCDEWIEALPAQENPPADEPDEPSDGYTNLVPTSTDTDGSIYNGTGYKDNVRLSSSGGVSGTAQDGTVTTGFMPWQSCGVIRIKGATFPCDQGMHYYVNFYKSDKSFFVGVDDNAVHNGSGVQALIEHSYDEATGVTTIDFSGLRDSASTAIGDGAINAAYFRICALGSGADLIVTVNQEITE